jgi:hypothetical protein
MTQPYSIYFQGNGAQLGSQAAIEMQVMSSIPQHLWTDKEYAFVASLQHVQQQKNP